MDPYSNASAEEKAWYMNERYADEKIARWREERIREERRREAMEELLRKEDEEPEEEEEEEKEEGHAMGSWGEGEGWRDDGEDDGFGERGDDSVSAFWKGGWRGNAKDHSAWGQEVPVAEDDVVPPIFSANASEVDDDESAGWEEHDTHGAEEDGVEEDGALSEDLLWDEEPEDPSQVEDSGHGYGEEEVKDNESIPDLLEDEEPANPTATHGENAREDAESIPDLLGDEEPEYPSQNDNYAGAGTGHDSTSGLRQQQGGPESISTQNENRQDNFDDGAVVGDEDGGILSEPGSDLLGSEEYENSSLASLEQYSVNNDDDDDDDDEPYLAKDTSAELENEYAEHGHDSRDNGEDGDEEHSDIFYDSKEVNSSYQNSNSVLSNQENNKTPDQTTTTASNLESFVPFFQYKLNHPSSRYTAEDLNLELNGIVHECLCGYFRTLHLPSDSQSPATGGREGNNKTAASGSSENCTHYGMWEKEFGRDECVSCHRWLPICALRCPGCGVRACMSCKFNRDSVMGNKRA